MKTKITDRMILKAGAALLSFGMLLGSFTWAGSLQVSAAAHDDDHYVEMLTEDHDGEVLDPYVTLANVEGKLFMGTEALTDPVKVTSSKGVYYQPNTYIYFGETYISELEAYVPVMLRVLSANKDNTGNSGAMFVMTEYADLSSTVF